MIRAGLQEATPGKLAVHEDIRPESRWSGLQMQRSILASAKQIAKILQEDSMPGFGCNQQTEVREGWFGLCQLQWAHLAHRSILDAGSVSW
jgi:hypothetical protein